MFKRFGGGSTLWKSKNPHSVEYLRYLHGVLVKNEKVTEQNRTLLVEAIRAIAEILIWGDQNDSSVFDFFLERQMFTHFISIMNQNSGSYVNVQLLQTLNILFENIRHETSLYFLLSNNHVNSIILHNFDFNNEEVIAYYISFLKTLSFKLNAHTVHFFYNESIDEFPLFTEAIRFFNHSESMVRIAVRTLTLNIFRIKDGPMARSVRKRSESYFDDVTRHIAEHVIDMDTFATFAHNEKSNRDRLLNMVDAHLDNMHYVNDILMIDCAELNTLLMDSLFKYLFGPLYLASLAGIRASGSATVLLSKVSALFLLAHFTMIIHDSEAVRLVLSTFFFGDENDVRTEWLRGMETGLQFSARAPLAQPHERVFFNGLLKSLGELHDDHAAFYALMLIYCISQNKGAISETLKAAQIPCVGKSKKCDNYLIEALLKIIENCAKKDTNIRSVTMELCGVVLRQMLLALESDDANDDGETMSVDKGAPLHDTVERAVRRALDALTFALRGVVFAENLFLEMFESEYYQLHCNELKMSMISENPGLYLSPNNTPLSGMPLSQRLPCGSDERIRRILQFYFILRKFYYDLIGETDAHLPLAQRMRPMAEVNDCINLNNSDLLSCTIVMEKGEKLSRFLVTDQFQLILVEPDNRKLGWAIVRFVGLLQDTQVVGDPSDSRALYIVVENVKTRVSAIDSRGSRAASVGPKKPMLSAKFVFDDHIRCMAAKQRLSKGRKNARHFKLNLIWELLGVKLNNGSSGISPALSLGVYRIGDGHCVSPNRTPSPATSTTLAPAGGVSQSRFYVPLLPNSSADRKPTTDASKTLYNFAFRAPGFVQKLHGDYLGAAAEHLRDLGALHLTDNNTNDNKNESVVRNSDDEGEHHEESDPSQSIPEDPVVEKPASHSNPNDNSSSNGVTNNTSNNFLAIHHI